MNATPTMCQYAETVLSIAVMLTSNTLIDARREQEDRVEHEDRRVRREPEPVVHVRLE